MGAVDQASGRIASGFANRRYLGYEVRLVVERNYNYDPHPIARPADIYRFMSDLSNESAEHVYELLLDTKTRITGVYLVGKGAVNRSLVMPSEIYKAALATNSPAFALVHNHPSGIPEPSRDDLDLAARVRSGADILGLHFMDFVIIGNGSYYSFLERGLPAIHRG